jgi:UDP-glucose 4-epimerase
MQLLAACQRAPGLERLVVKSSAEVYGSSNRDPAMFTEDMSAKRLPRSGYAKDVLEVEGYVRGFSRRRPDVTVTMLRKASTVASFTSSPLTDYLRLSPTPKVMGFDARIQLLHYDDLVGVLHHATLAGVHGTFNVAGDGVLMMSQVIRRLGRVALPVPSFAISSMGSLAKQVRLGLEDFSPEQVGYFTYGRGLDTTRMRTVLGFEPRYTTEHALAELATSMQPRPPADHPLVAVESLLAGARGGKHDG